MKPNARNVQGHRGGTRGRFNKDSGKTLKRLLSYIMRNYKKQFIFVLVCIVFSAIANVASSMFIKTLIDSYIEPLIGSANPDFSGLLSAILMMATIFIIGILSTLFYTRMMVNISQGVLKEIRVEMFSKMQSLPIRYFDTHTHC